MINQLNIIHSKHGNHIDIPKDNTEWKTCLRSIYFLKDSSLSSHSGAQAYELLLEILCGLHSPMIGETEIVSQFKSFLEEEPNLITQKISDRLIQDTKSLRTKYLTNYGSQSYGSYTLNKAKGLKKIVLLGAGTLVHEIIPIIKDFSGEIVVKSRSPLKSVELARNFPQVRLESLEPDEEIYEDALLVVAAPLASERLEKLIKKQFLNSSILDMRSTQDGPALKIDNQFLYKNLTEIFSEIEETQKILQYTASNMKTEIKELSLRWLKKAQVRPFGWEDLCC